MAEGRQHDRLEVKVTPGAARSQIGDVREGVLQVKIGAPPVRGKANRELIDFLARALGVSRAAVSIVRGGTGRNKLVEVAGLDRREIIRRLSTKNEGRG
jgi:uncharacterized protein